MSAEFQAVIEAADALRLHLDQLGATEQGVGTLDGEQFARDLEAAVDLARSLQRTAHTAAAAHERRVSELLADSRTMRDRVDELELFRAFAGMLIDELYGRNCAVVGLHREGAPESVDTLFERFGLFGLPGQAPKGGRAA